MIRFCLLNAMLVCLAACGGRPSPSSEILPGRSRPLLQHDWKHPRDFRFAPVAFTPPDPADSLVATTSGLRAFVVESGADYTVRITAAIPLGRLYERSGETGAAAVLSGALAGIGSTAPAAQTRLDRLEALGGRLETAESPDLTVLSLEVLPGMWRDGLDFIIQSLRAPLLDTAAVARSQAGPGYSPVTAGIGGEDFRPKVELERLLGGYPLAPPEAGTIVAASAVKALADRTLRPDAVVLGIGGNISRDAVRTALEQMTLGWRGSGERGYLTPFAPAAAPAGGFRAIDSAETSQWVPRQGWIAIGRVIEAVPDTEQPDLAVMAEVLDNRLNIVTREMRGLSNRTALVVPDTATRSGLLHIRSGGRPESVPPLVKLSLDELRRLHAGADPITDAEMRRAKGTLVLAAWQRSLDGAGEASRTFATETVRRGSPEYLLRWPELVEAVTVADVRQAARAYLDPAAMSAVVVGPVEKIRRARHPRWPVTLDELGFQVPGGTTTETR